MVCSHCLQASWDCACGLYTVIVYLVWTQGPEVIERALASLKALLGLGLIA